MPDASSKLCDLGSLSGDDTTASYDVPQKLLSQPVLLGLSSYTAIYNVCHDLVDIYIFIIHFKHL